MSTNRFLTALLLGFVRPILAVLHIITHLAAVNAFSIPAEELQRSFTLCG